MIDQKELRQLATGADLDPKAFAKQMRSLNVKLNAKELGMLFCAFDNDGDGTVAAKEFAKHLSDVKTEEKTKRERLAREDNSYFWSGSWNGKLPLLPNTEAGSGRCGGDVE